MIIVDRERKKNLQTCFQRKKNVLKFSGDNIFDLFSFYNLSLEPVTMHVMKKKLDN